MSLLAASSTVRVYMTCVITACSTGLPYAVLGGTFNCRMLSSYNK